MKLSLPLLCLATAAMACVAPRLQLAPSPTVELSAEEASGGMSSPLPGRCGCPTAMPSWAAGQDDGESPSPRGTTSPALPGTGAHPEAVPGSATERGITESPGLDTEVPVGPASASPMEPEGLPEPTGTAASAPTGAPVPTATEGPSGAPGTTAPPCPGDEELPETCGAPTGAQKAAVAEALGTFALRFYQRMAEAAEPSANLLFSPINVALGLSHLLLGARGETRQRLRAVLAYPPTLPCVHGALRLLAKAPGLLAASQIFHHPELRLEPRFLNASWRLYEARPQALSGNESLDLLHINKWVREATRGHVGRLLEQLPPDARLVLLSAVYLQAKWQQPFRAKETVPQPFERPGRPAVLVPTMTSKKYPVATFSEPALQAQVGRLQLGQGLSLVVLLPAGGPGALQALERALHPAAFLALLRKALATAPRATMLALPRFRLDLAQDVVDIIHDMDYGLFLDAELCGLAPEAAVDTLQHRAVLALDEAGVEAAGALAVSLARTALVFEALRPFLFTVVEDAAALPLFMGRLSDPQP